MNVKITKFLFLIFAFIPCWLFAQEGSENNTNTNANANTQNQTVEQRIADIMGDSQDSQASTDVEICNPKDYADGFKCYNRNYARLSEETAQLTKRKQDVEARLAQCKDTCREKSRLDAELTRLNSQITSANRQMEGLKQFRSQLTANKREYDSAVKNVKKQNQLVSLQIGLNGAATTFLGYRCIQCLKNAKACFSTEGSTQWSGWSCVGTAMAAAQMASAAGNRGSLDDIEKKLNNYNYQITAPSVGNPSGGIASPWPDAPKPACYGPLCVQGKPPDITFTMPEAMGDALKEYCKEGKDCVKKIGKGKASIAFKDFDSDLAQDKFSSLPASQKKAFNKAVSQAQSEVYGKELAALGLLDPKEASKAKQEDEDSQDSQIQLANGFMSGGSLGTKKALAKKKKKKVDPHAVALKRKLSGLFDQFQNQKSNGKGVAPSKSVTLGEDTIGVLNDNIFHMIHERYQERNTKDQFISNPS